MDDSGLYFASFPILGWFTTFGEKWPLDFTGVDFAGHCNQADVSSKLIISWRVLRVSMIVGEPKWAPHSEGMIPILKRTQVGITIGDFVILCLIRRMGLLDCPQFGFADRCDQGRCALEVGVLSEILRVCDSG